MIQTFDVLPIVLGTWSRKCALKYFNLIQFIVIIVQHIRAPAACSSNTRLGCAGAQRQLAIAHAGCIINVAACNACLKIVQTGPETLLCLVIGGNVAIAMLRPHALTARGHCACLRLPAAAALVQAYQMYGAIELNARETSSRADLWECHNCHKY